MYKLKSIAYIYILFTLLSGCSAMVVASANDIEKFISFESTPKSIENKLGAPIKTNYINPPKDVRKLSADFQSSTVYAFNSSKSNVSQLIVKESYYKYEGTIKLNKEVGTLLSASIMSLGLAEFYMLPAAIGYRFADNEYLFIVWYDIDDTVQAYSVSRVQY